MRKNVLDYLDFERINTLLEGFNKSTGFVTAILDLEGNVLSKSGWRRICTEFYRVNPKTNKNCLISDTELANMSIDNKYNIYKCHNGLYDVSVPLKIDNEHVANIFTGQFFMDAPSEKFFQDQAEQYGFELKSYIEALRNVPIVTKEKVNDIVEFLLNITNIIVDLTKDMIEQENLRVLLESSLESFNDILIWAVDKEYKYLYFNNAFKTGMKQLYDANITVGDRLLELINAPKDRAIAKENHDLAFNGESHIEIEEYGIDDKRYFESSFSPIYDEYKNIIGATGFSRDITTRVTHENQIKQKEKNLLEAQKIAKIGSWRLDAKNNHVEWTEELYKMYGFDPSLPPPNFTEHKKIFTPESWGRLSNSIDLAISKGIPYELELQMLKNDDTTGWMWTRAEIEKNINGEIIAIHGVAQDITEKRKTSEKLLYISYHDSLTGLYNRRYYEDNLEKLDIAENYPLTIVMSDINGLKLVNDAFGHSAGDKLLISAAKVISNSCRETDMVARIGGDEFIIAMPNTSELEAEKIIKEINIKTKKITIESIELSISFGFATKNHTEIDIHETFRSAEDQMYRVKLLEIPSMRSSAIETILNTLYEKDKSSEVHSRTVSQISERISVAYGMNSQEVSVVKTAGLLHDIGKIIIPISIITKKGKLTSEEYNLIKGHPEIGFRILNSTHDMRSVSNIVLSHHERWDGNGYPRGIKADDIPLQSRIIFIADSFDAMTSERTYRKIFTNEEALDEICKNSGTQFDPKLVEIFKAHFDEIIDPQK